MELSVLSSHALRRMHAIADTVHAIDVALSAPLFNLQIGTHLETLLSIPGCAFGMPAATPTLALTLLRPPAHMQNRLLAIQMLLAAPLVALWRQLLFGSARAAAFRKLYHPAWLVVAPLLVALVARAVDAAAGGAHLFLLAWLFAVALVLLVKSATRRKRPVAGDDARAGAQAPPKALDALRRVLVHDARGALPSGDVAGAASYALARWACACARGGGGASVGAWCVLLSGVGRVYWRAHHVLDVVGGFAVASVAWRVVAGAAAGGDPECACDATMGQVIVAQLAVVGLLKAGKYGNMAGKIQGSPAAAEKKGDGVPGRKRSAQEPN